MSGSSSGGEQKGSYAVKKQAEVICERLGASNGVARLTLNRERALNSLTVSMCISINEALAHWLPDADLRCLILRGAGSKAFCAGGDVKSIACEAGPFTPGMPGSVRADFFRQEYLHDFALAQAKELNTQRARDANSLMQISLWNGVVMGGGVGLSIHGAFRVATETTLWAMPETAIGLFPDVGSSYFLSRLPGGLGPYIALLGARLRAHDLLHAGLATHYVTAAQLPELEAALIDDDGKSPADVLARFAAAADPPQEGAGSNLAGNAAAIDRCFAGKHDVEGVVAALQAEDTEWSKNTLKTLQKLSPSSLKLTLLQLQKGRGLSLRGCFEMEFRMAQRCVTSPDFLEGVRAVLIDKDNAPKWSPTTLQEVSLQSLEKHFEPLGGYELLLPA